MQDTLKNNVLTQGGQFINDYGKDLTPQISETAAPGLSEAHSLTGFFSSAIPQPANCDVSAITFTLSGHVMQLDCARFERLKVWIGWALWLMTIYACIEIALSKPSSEAN